MSEKAQLNPLLKLALDLGPLILFFLVNARLGIFWATGVFMVAVLVALAAKFGLPVHFIGIGEGVEDLAPFTARDFARAIAGIET